MEEEGLPCCLSHAFFATAARFPDRIAVIDVNHDEKILDGEPLQNRPTIYPGDRVYTYKELEDSANSLAARLDWEFGALQHGGSSEGLQIMESKGGACQFGSNSRTHSKECQLEACPISTGAALYSINCNSNKSRGKVVGIMIGNSAAYLISVLAVLRAGGVFVPLDPSWPTQRIAEIVADSHIFLVLVCNYNGGLLEASNLKSSGVKLLNLSQDFSLEDINLEQSANCFAMEMPFCYIIYTSGSSGKPKGVCGTEKGLLNRLYWMAQAYPYGRDEIACFKTSIGFIDHLTESLGPLLMGITLVVPPTCGLRHDPASLLQYIKAYRITRLTAVPSLMLCLLPALTSLRGSQLASIRVLILSGETLPFWLYQELQYMMPEATILNLYGSTEVSGDCTYFDCKLMACLQQETSTVSVLIGKVIPGFSLLIYDGTEFSNSRTEGELCVSGIGLAHGYINDTAGTAGKFVQLSDSSGISVESNRVFKTGDLVREVGDGNFAFLGRVDRLIKIHGQRIEQEEIEIVLKQHPSVAHAAVLYTGAQLVAYIMPSSEGDLVPVEECILDAEQHIQKSIQKWLTNRLPLYMLPGRFIFLNRMPLTQSGKVDYSALSDMEMCKAANKEIVETEFEYISALEHIKKVFASVLMVQVSSSDDFFLLGGTSVSAAQAAYVLGVKMQLLYEHKTPLALFKAMKDTEIFSQWLDGESDFKIQEVSSFSEPLRLDHLQNDQANLTIKCQSICSLTDANLGRPSAVNDENNYVGKAAPESQQEIDEGEMYPAKRRKHFLVTGIEHESHAHKNTTVPSLSDGSRKSCWPSQLFNGPTAIVRCNRVIASYPYKIRQIICEQSPKTSCSKRWSLHVTWKCALSACVDASPLLVFKGGIFRIYIGSHAHVFMCLDACSGLVRWQCHLGGRIESTASITLDFMQVVVGCYDGFIYFLDLENGNELWKYATGAEVKCQPVVDVGSGLIWCGSHDHKIYALDPISRSCVWELDCGGSIFAASAINIADRVMYVGTTSGTMMAILLEPLPKLAWKYDCGGPVFGSPAADPCTRRVIIPSVGGHVIALTEDGSLAWQAMVDSPIFAGVCISSVFSHQALVCSRGGCLYAFSLLDGILLWKFAFSEPITTAVWVDEELELSYAAKKSRLICVTGTTGNVYILEVESEYKSENKNPAEYGHLGPHLIATLNLHGEIFSSPIMVNGRIFVGCRDNNIYCIDLCEEVDQ